MVSGYGGGCLELNAPGTNITKLPPGCHQPQGSKYLLLRVP